MKLRGIAVICAVAVVFFGTALVAVLIPEQRAKRFIARFDSIARSHSPENLPKVILEYGGEKEDIAGGDVVYRVRFRNSVLRAIRLAPSTVLSASAYVHDGNVQYVAVFYTVNAKGGAIDLGIYDYLTAKAEPPFTYEDVSRTGTHEQRTRIRFTYDAASQLRENALMLQTACLSKMGGCTQLEQLLPNLRNLAAYGE